MERQILDGQRKPTLRRDAKHAVAAIRNEAALSQALDACSVFQRASVGQRLERRKIAWLQFLCCPILEAHGQLCTVAAHSPAEHVRENYACPCDTGGNSGCERGSDHVALTVEYYLP